MEIIKCRVFYGTIFITSTLWRIIANTKVGGWNSMIKNAIYQVITFLLVGIIYVHKRRKTNGVIIYFFCFNQYILMTRYSIQYFT